MFLNSIQKKPTRIGCCDDPPQIIASAVHGKVVLKVLSPNFRLGANGK